MRLMICLDGSRADGPLLDRCRVLAEGTGAEVQLVRVLPQHLDVTGVPWSGSDAVDIAKHEEAEREQEHVRAELGALARSFAVPVTVAVLTGTHIGDALLRHARGERIDVIALGCRQRGPLHGGVGGATMRHIVERGIAPVLLGPMVGSVSPDPARDPPRLRGLLPGRCAPR